MREVLLYVAQEFEKLVSFYLVGEIIQYISQRVKRVVANPIEQCVNRGFLRFQLPRSYSDRDSKSI